MGQEGRTTWPQGTANVIWDTVQGSIRSGPLGYHWSVTPEEAMKMPENPAVKEGEVLPKGEDKLTETVQGLADAFMKTEEEKTRRLEMRLRARNEWTPESRRDFVATIWVLAIATLVMAGGFTYAFIRSDSCFIMSLMTAFLGFLGGFGIGKTQGTANATGEES